MSGPSPLGELPIGHNQVEQEVESRTGLAIPALALLELAHLVIGEVEQSHPRVMAEEVENAPNLSLGKTQDQARQVLKAKLQCAFKLWVLPFFEVACVVDEPAPQLFLTAKAIEPALEVIGDGRLAIDVENQLRVAATKGLHRVTWNLHRPGSEAWERSSVEREFDNSTGRGASAPPGHYTLHFGTMVNGVFKDLGLAPGEAILIPL